jgi:hypothetical protein
MSIATTHSEQKYTTKITVDEGRVSLSLPDGNYIKMTPEQARQIGGRLFLKAAAAEGKPSPAMIALTVED